MRGRIVVIADDLSGAAELAGIAFARGLSAEVQRSIDMGSEADVIAVDTDSRSLSPPTAAALVGEIARLVMESQPAWIYKKVDSLLRGPVRAEVEAVQQVAGLSRTVLIPANPSRGRTIQHGRYLVEGVPLDSSSLADDPEYPRQSASVLELLGGSAVSSVVSEAADRPLFGSGIFVPDVATAEHVQQRAQELDEQTLPAGAADFFAALLGERCRVERIATASATPWKLAKPALLVCGSRTAYAQRAAECLQAGVPVRTFLPPLKERHVAADELPAWADRFAARLTSAGTLLLAIGDSRTAADSSQLLSRLAHLVALILERTPVTTLLAEGGATAGALVRHLGWTRFAVTQASPAGVGLLRPVAARKPVQLAIKPGSYPWPAEVWQQLGAAETQDGSG